MLARHIEDEDASRVVKMNELLDSWGEPTASATPVTEVRALVGVNGIEFNAQWTALMLEHHTQAMALVDVVKRDGSNRMVNNLAAGMRLDLGFETSTIESI